MKSILVHQQISEQALVETSRGKVSLVDGSSPQQQSYKEERIQNLLNESSKLTNKFLEIPKIEESVNIEIKNILHKNLKNTEEKNLSSEELLKLLALREADLKVNKDLNIVTILRKKILDLFRIH